MKQGKELISVIVPIYKVEQFLEQCIQSIVTQTYQNLEIILVDDGSPDNCGRICDKWAIKDERIRVIHKVNGGLSDARNAGIEIATGDYIAFVDSDDWIDPNMYETLLNVLKKEDATFCACGIMITYSDKEIPYPCVAHVGQPEDFLNMIYRETVFPVSAANKLFKRQCWENMRFPKGKLCEDAFTTYRLVDQAKRIVQISAPMYHYCIRSNSIMTQRFRSAKMDEEEAWRYNYEYMMEHHPRIAKIAYDFYLQKVNVLIHTITPEQRKEFVQEYRYLYKILKKNQLYILFRSKLGWKNRIRLLLDYINLPELNGNG